MIEVEVKIRNADFPTLMVCIHVIHQGYSYIYAKIIVL